jgi:2-keto-myo-inositol isomerase
VDDRQVTPLVDVLRELVPMFKGRAVVPLIEPIGFATSSIRCKAPLVKAIEQVDPDLFRMVHDTFQHCISGESELFPELTGMLHISGISDPSVTLDHEQDAHRIWVDADDRCGNIAQIANLLDGGYQGGVSFECTAPGNFGADGLAQMQASFAYIEGALA